MCYFKGKYYAAHKNCGRQIKMNTVRSGQQARDGRYVLRQWQNFAVALDGNWAKIRAG